MFFSMTSFELRYYLRQPSFYIVSLLLLFISFVSVASSDVAIGSGGEVLRNGAYAITLGYLTLGIFALFLVVNFVGSSAIRNQQHRMEELIYSRAIPPFSYQAGRFFGSYLVVLLVFSTVPLGMLLGSWMPWIDPDVLGPSRLSLYIQPFLLLSAPNLLLLSALFYTVAIRFRSMMALYLLAVALLVFYLLSGSFASQPEYRSWAALLDPFTARTYSDMTRYWTIVEKNTQLVALSGVLLHNRLLWLSVAAACLALAGLHRLPKLERTEKKSKQAKPGQLPSAMIPKVSPQFSAWPMFAQRLRFETRQLIVAPSFIILAILTVVLLILPLTRDFGWYGTSNWPITQDMIDNIVNGTTLMMIVILVYYSAEVVWRERQSGMGDIIDSLPVPNWVFWCSKFLAVSLVLALLLLVGMLVSVIFQLSKGVEQLELLQYGVRLGYFILLPSMLVIVLAFFLHAISVNKYMGMGLFVGYYLLTEVMSSWGFGHSLFNYAASPQLRYSDMNGYGWWLVSHSWYMLYWGAIATVLFILGYGLYQRGPLPSLAARLRQLRYQLSGAGVAVMATALLVATGSGSYLYYQTQVLNDYRTPQQQRDWSADYEKTFRPYAEMPILTATAVNADIAIYPAERRIEAHVDFSWQNKSAEPIERILVQWPAYTPVLEVTIAGAHLSERDPRFSNSWLSFEQPIPPGAEVRGQIYLQRINRGIRENNFDLEVVENGTFINNLSLLPGFGYQQHFELQDRHERSKRDLAPRLRDNPLEDERFYQQNFFGPGSDFIDFEAVVSTSSDQIAIVPGYLQREWQQDGRNYFHYKMDQPMVNFYSINSGRYQVAQEQHGDVVIEVYYHPAHGWNVERMMESVRDSLDYFSAAFGPYQHRQLRIIEFPGYRSFAQSFANTVPYSERIGFITDLRKLDNIDPVYYVTAHEVAHQWWGHQVGAANVQGNAIISESLSQYAALMVMEKKYGAEKMRRFLRHELDRYLSGRSNESIAEQPLLRSEQQRYIHYNKGSVVMMAIKHVLGEQRMNANLAAFAERFRYRSDPYPTTLDLLSYLLLDTTATEAAFIEDQFHTIRLYDLRLQGVAIAEQDDGSFLVTLDIFADKLQADGRGEQQSDAMDEAVEIGFFRADPDNIRHDPGLIYLQPHRLQSGDNRIEILLQERPEYAAVDPYIRLIDRETSDNIRRLPRP